MPCAAGLVDPYDLGVEQWRTPDEILQARLRIEESMPDFRQPAAHALGVATVSPAGAVLDTWFPQVNTDDHKLPAAVLATVCGYRDSTATFTLTNDQLAEAVEALTPAEACHDFDHPNLWTWRSLLNATPPADRVGGSRRFIAAFIADLDDPLVDSHDAYLRLHLLSHRLVRPHGMNLDDIFSVLPNVVWTDHGGFAVDEFAGHQRAFYEAGVRPVVHGVDKFPRMLDYVVPSGVRIADASRVRLGAHLAEGTVVMHEGFCNFNAGTLGPAMIEGRISAGVVVDSGSDLGGGSSVMGTLSGGGRETIVVGRGVWSEPTQGSGSHSATTARSRLASTSLPAPSCVCPTAPRRKRASCRGGPVSYTGGTRSRARSRSSRKSRTRPSSTPPSTADPSQGQSLSASGAKLRWRQRPTRSCVGVSEVGQPAVGAGARTSPCCIARMAAAARFDTPSLA